VNPASKESQAVVMLVGPFAAQAAMAPPEDHACRASIRLDRCPDVYRALARILATPKDQPAIVVVALECVGPRELAFFSSAFRWRAGLPVLVHGHGADDPCVSRAIDCGATGALSPGYWDTLVPRKPVEAPGTVAPCFPVEPVARATTVAEAPVDDGAEPRDEPEEIGEEPETPGDTPSPRVPWLRYADGPARTAPTVRTPPPPTPVPPTTKPATPSEADYEPLLTDGELEALMADDISTIVPKTDPSWRGNEGLGGRT
jgi:hypothetical protein